MALIKKCTATLRVSINVKQMQIRQKKSVNAVKFLVQELTFTVLGGGGRLGGGNCISLAVLLGRFPSLPPSPTLPRGILHDYLRSFPHLPIMEIMDIIHVTLLRSRKMIVILVYPTLSGSELPVRWITVPIRVFSIRIQIRI